ncbi:3-isopropylmalate dehydrogenase [Stella humosa]|uniref:3-isopropylmalate dehydrogenase n=1 Tax=Stella humosa TaxID=94 RepID=A0A3N1KSH6_9PROT|nr:isocitrate/isopropylmalate dehydrogenase family protein [Stella humosa]ROP81066.1 3-isopropylmalate dehydrogenase [Stella humosa]BBK29756.1 3-isopropylmalate dehydrogenase [Stella humosa]
MSDLNICVLPGDGIGVEVMGAARAVLSTLEKRFGFRLAAEEHPGGAAYWRETGREMPQGAWEAARSADAILFGSMGLPDVRYPDGTEIAPHLKMRVDFDLFAGVRPIRRLPNTPAVLASPRAADIDLVIIRELTEGLFASRGKGVVIDDREARDTLVITRATSEKLFDFAFDLARRRKAKGSAGLVTCVDKANVFVSMAFFRKIFDERARNFPDVEARHHYVDAAALDLVRKPWVFDVMVMENMYADILSDVGGGIVGGMGLAPSAEIGLEHALFQPAHGSAPDIAGQGLANPTAMLLSTAMMLEWLGHRHGRERLVEAADALDAAVERAFAEGAAFPAEIGGPHGTAEVTRAVMDRIA